MVAKAGSTPRKSGYTPVKLAYNHNGKTVTRKVLVQNGMKLAFDGSNKAEQGKYTVGNNKITAGNYFVIYNGLTKYYFNISNDLTKGTVIEILINDESKPEIKIDNTVMLPKEDVVVVVTKEGYVKSVKSLLLDCEKRLNKNEYKKMKELIQKY